MVLGEFAEPRAKLVSQTSQHAASSKIRLLPFTQVGSIGAWEMRDCVWICSRHMDAQWYF